MQASERWACLAIWVVPAMWAGNYIVARTAPGVIEPYTLALGRWTVAGAILVAVARRELWSHRHAIAAVWYQYVALGFCGMVVCGAWVYVGAKTTVAMNIALIYSASPVLIALGSVLWLNERLRWPQVLGIVLAMAGVLHVVVQGQWMALTRVHWVAGDAWIVAAMVSWAAYALMQKLWPSPLGSTARLAATCIAGVALLLPGALWEISQASSHTLSWAAVGLVVGTALGPGVIAYWLYGWAQKLLGASQAAMTLYLGPLYAALAAWAILGESLGLHHLLGAMLILPGVYLVARR